VHALDAAVRLTDFPNELATLIERNGAVREIFEARQRNLAGQVPNAAFRDQERFRHVRPQRVLDLL
jgi:hypothetical protein